MARRLDPIALSKPFVFVACLLPLAWLVWLTAYGDLGPDPVARLEHETGAWALRLLLATLALLRSVRSAHCRAREHERTRGVSVQRRDAPGRARRRRRRR